MHDPCAERVVSHGSIDVENDRQSSILVVGDSSIAKVMRLASPELANRIVAVPEEPEANANQLEDARGLSSLKAFAQSNATVGCVVLSNVPNAILARQIAALSWSKSASCLILAGATEKQLRQWRDVVKVHNVSHIEPVELMAHQAAADFYFWTGVLPSIDLIRDSLEEYLQW